jgi:hypothetical protein
VPVWQRFTGKNTKNDVLAVVPSTLYSAPHCQTMSCRYILIGGKGNLMPFLLYKE